MAPEGWPFVRLGLALAGITLILGLLIPGSYPLLQLGFLSLAGLFGFFTAFTGFFFRDPVRVRPGSEGLVLAPADGKIVEVSELPEADPFVGPAMRISIFLSIFNVHIQRAPVSGKVLLKEYRPGGFAIAWKPKASEENEQATLGFAADSQRVMVRQIAGLVARRIVTDPKEGEVVPQGSRIGIIRFGSRVDLFLPTDWEMTCQVGDRVQAGLTVLARVGERTGEER